MRTRLRRRLKVALRYACYGLCMLSPIGFGVTWTHPPVPGVLRASRRT
jgi:hypothetical protein